MTDAKRLSFLTSLNSSVDEVKTASILGFVFVSMVDEAQKKVRLVIPCGGDLPGTILLCGNIRWNLEYSVCCKTTMGKARWNCQNLVSTAPIILVMNAVFGKLILDRIIAKLVEGRARDKQWRVKEGKKQSIIAKYKRGYNTPIDPENERGSHERAFVAETRGPYGDRWRYSWPIS